MNEIRLDTDNDFGFTTHSESDLMESDEMKLATQNKAQMIYDAILPLLNNLMKDSDKNEYIRWPNRKEKIQSFIKRLDNILNS